MLFFILFSFNISCYFKSYFHFEFMLFLISISCILSFLFDVCLMLYGFQKTSVVIFFPAGFLNIDSGEVPKLYRENRKSLIINRLPSKLLQMVYK